MGPRFLQEGLLPEPRGITIFSCLVEGPPAGPTRGSKKSLCLEAKGYLPSRHPILHEIVDIGLDGAGKGHDGVAVEAVGRLFAVTGAS